jgi:hypothetical protein
MAGGCSPPGVGNAVTGEATATGVVDMTTEGTPTVGVGDATPGDTMAIGVADNATGVVTTVGVWVIVPGIAPPDGCAGVTATTGVGGYVVSLDVIVTSPISAMIAATPIRTIATITPMRMNNGRDEGAG